MKNHVKSLLKRIPIVRKYGPHIRSMLTPQGLQLRKKSPTTEQICDLVENHLMRAGGEKELYEAMHRRGIYLLRDHYYRPFVNKDALSQDFWTKQSALSGLEIDAQESLDWARTNLDEYIRELRSFLAISKEESADGKLYLINGTYMAVDAHVYYALIRYAQPKRIIEVGAGFSTLFAYEAIKRASGPTRSNLNVIEPYPDAIIKSGLASVATVRKDFVQNVEPSYFDQLEAGDILFIDSTHTVKEGGDVVYLYLEILPRLKPGVYVHIHDVSLPEPYPSCYLDYGWFWNEQYLLQAYLVNNSKTKIIWPGNYLMCKHPEEMLKLFPEIKDMRAVYPQSAPSAFWFQTT